MNSYVAIIALIVFGVTLVVGATLLFATALLFWRAIASVGWPMALGKIVAPKDEGEEPKSGAAKSDAPFAATGFSFDAKVARNVSMSTQSSSWTKPSTSGGALASDDCHRPQWRRIFSTTSCCGGSMKAINFIWPPHAEVAEKAFVDRRAWPSLRPRNANARARCQETIRKAGAALRRELDVAITHAT